MAPPPRATNPRPISRSGGCTTPRRRPAPSLTLWSPRASSNLRPWPIPLSAARTLSRIALVFAAIALGSSCGLFERLEDAECPPGGTALTFDNFGKPFLDKYCNYCHGSQILDRKGAPPAYVFETPEQIEKWASRIYVRAAGNNDSMPPGPDDPPAEERRKLAEWLACEYGD